MRLAVFAAAVCLLASQAFSQGRGGGGRGAGAGRGGAAPSPKATAAIDMTGYWVSVVTEDWMFRMVTPPKGQYLGVPLNGAARTVANAWDPAKDEAAGEQCKSYGAAAVMRVPGRLHITWDNDTTLKVETEAGTQTRRLIFGPPAAAAANAPSWQGVSAAAWEFAGRGRGRGGPPPQYGDLKVVTTHMKPGYLQKNGVPYGENAVLTEYFSRANEPNGDSWLILTHVVEDPQYLNGPFVRSTHYKKLPDAAATQWSPEPCSAR